MQLFSLFPNLLQTHAVRLGAATGCLHSALWAKVCISAVLSSQPHNHLLSAPPSLASPAFDAGVNRSCVWFSSLCYHCFVLCLGLEGVCTPPGGGVRKSFWFSGSGRSGPESHVSMSAAEARKLWTTHSKETSKSPAEYSKKLDTRFLYFVVIYLYFDKFLYIALAVLELSM